MSYLVLEVRPYDFKDEEGRRIAGTKVTYLDPRSPLAEPAKGLTPLSVGADDEALATLPTVPGFYDFDFRFRGGARGKAVPVLASARFVRAADLTGP